MHRVNNKVHVWRGETTPPNIDFIWDKLGTLYRYNLETELWELLSDENSLYVKDIKDNIKKNSKAIENTNSNITDLNNKLLEANNTIKQEVADRKEADKQIDNKINSKVIKSVTVTGDKKKVVTIVTNDNEVYKSDEFEDLDTNTDLNTNSLNFNTKNGVFTAHIVDDTNPLNNKDVTVNLDGRYLLKDDITLEVKERKDADTKLTEKINTLETKVNNNKNKTIKSVKVEISEDNPKNKRIVLTTEDGSNINSLDFEDLSFDPTSLEEKLNNEINQRTKDVKELKEKDSELDSAIKSIKLKINDTNTTVSNLESLKSKIESNTQNINTEIENRTNLYSSILKKLQDEINTRQSEDSNIREEIKKIKGNLNEDTDTSIKSFKYKETGSLEIVEQNKKENVVKTFEVLISDKFASKDHTHPNINSTLENHSNTLDSLDKAIKSEASSRSAADTDIKNRLTKLELNKVIDTNTKVSGIKFNDGTLSIELQSKDGKIEMPVSVSLDGRYALEDHNHDSKYAKVTKLPTKITIAEASDTNNINFKFFNSDDSLLFNEVVPKSLFGSTNSGSNPSTSDSELSKLNASKISNLESKLNQEAKTRKDKDDYLDERIDTLSRRVSEDTDTSVGSVELDSSGNLLIKQIDKSGSPVNTKSVSLDNRYELVNNSAQHLTTTGSTSDSILINLENRNNEKIDSINIPINKNYKNHILVIDFSEIESDTNETYSNINEDTEYIIINKLNLSPRNGEPLCRCSYKDENGTKHINVDFLPTKLYTANIRFNNINWYDTYNKIYYIIIPENLKIGKFGGYPNIDFELYPNHIYKEIISIGILFKLYESPDSSPNTIAYIDSPGVYMISGYSVYKLSNKTNFIGGSLLR